MKKKIRIIIPAVLVILVLFFVSTGFVRETSVVVTDYSVSENGREITLRLDTTDSAGGIRKTEIYQQYGGHLYLDCFSAFMGSVGEKNEFTVNLNRNTEMIALYKGNNSYQAVLEKNSDGEWIPVK